MTPLLLALLLLLPLATPAGEAPPPIADFHSRYGIYKGPLKIGEAERTLGRDQQGPYYRAVTRPVGIAAWVVDLRLEDFSRLQWVDGRPRPLSYRQRREGRSPRLIEQHYDWQAMIAHSRYNGEPFEIPLRADAVDQNMYLVALMADLARGERPEELHVVEGKKMKTYRLHYPGKRRIGTPWGELETVGVERRDKKETTQVWSAPALGYVPVLIVHHGDGGRLEARLERLSGPAAGSAPPRRTHEDWD